MLLRNFLTLFSPLPVLPALLALLLMLVVGCAPQVSTVTITRAMAVPYPTRPDFVQLHNGDVACMSYAARQRLGQRHTLTVWYLRELENALKTYDAQTEPRP